MCFIRLLVAGEPGEYYIPGITSTVKSLVTGLEKFCSIRGCNISMDHQYTSINLFEWLLERKVTAVGTIMVNEKGIPPELKTTEFRDNHSYAVLWETTQEKLSLHSYVVKSKRSGEKNILVLSTLISLLAMTNKDSNRKPAIFKLYDFTKEGSNVMSQRIGMYTTNPKSQRWVSTAFSYLLDTIRVNSQTVYSMNSHIDLQQCNSFKYCWELANSLALPHIMRRNQNPLNFSIRAKINMFVKPDMTDHTHMECHVVPAHSSTSHCEAFVDYEDSTREHNKTPVFSSAKAIKKFVKHPGKAAKRRRCQHCLEEACHDPKRRHNLAGLKNQCQLCGVVACINHMKEVIHFCNSCANK